MTARLPWDHIDVGLEDGFLLGEYRKALKGRASPPCGKVAGMLIHHTNLADAEPDRRKLVCYDCGVACDLSKMRDDLHCASNLGAVEQNTVGGYSMTDVDARVKTRLSNFATRSTVTTTALPLTTWTDVTLPTTTPATFTLSFGRRPVTSPKVAVMV